MPSRRWFNELVSKISGAAYDTNENVPFGAQDAVRLPVAVHYHGTDEVSHKIEEDQ